MSIEPNTHLQISPVWVGEPVKLTPGQAVVRLRTNPEMCADERGLIHGGFTFGLADYAAMLAVNDPKVVLGAADSRFLAPVQVGEVMEARAEIVEEKGKKRVVKCSVETDKPVFEASFTCFVLEAHVFDL